MTITVQPPGRATERLSRPAVPVLLLTCAGGFLVSLDVSVANAVLPAVGTSFHLADRAQLAWIITAYAIVFAAALVPTGRLADRLGRRRAYLAGLATFAAGSGLCGAAPDLAVLVAGRIVQGVGAAAVSPASIGLLLAAADVRHRSVYAARWAGIAAIGICAGPILGGTLTTLMSWRLAFLMNVPLVLVIGWARHALPETPRAPGRALSDPLGALCLATGTAALTFAISEAPRYSISSGRIESALFAALVLTGAFILRSARVADPVLDLRLMRRRRVAFATVTTALYSCAFFGLLLTFVLFLVAMWGFSVLAAGLTILPTGLIVAGMTLRVGRMAERFGFRTPLVLGSLLMAAGLIAAIAVGGPSYTPRWFAAEVLIAIGIGLCYPLLIAASVAGLPSEDLAAASAVAQSARQLGAAIGVAVAVAILGTADRPTLPDFHASWLVAAGFSALAAITAAAIGKG